MPTYITGHDEILAEGSYAFTVIDAIEKQSQNGNPMIELQMVVGGTDGGKNGGVRIFDHLVFTAKSYWKLDSFRIATGEKLTPGQTVSFEAEDCIDRTGKVWLTVESYGGRKRNKVSEYLDPAAEIRPPAAPSPKREPPSLEEQFGDDDIPMK